MGKGIVKLGEGQWATKDGKLLAAKETNGRFKNAEFTVTRGSDATYTDKDGLIKRVSAPRNRNTTSSNTLDLFVLAGQSNAMGWLGNASSYPPQEPNLLDSSIKLNYEQIGTTSKSDGWQTLGPQQRQNYGEIFGPEVTFSRLLKRGGYNPAIFKYTEGSTSLADDWKAPGQSGHYDTMVTKFNAAVLDLQNQGYTVNIAGFIWIQGEQDATDATDAGNYQSNLNAIISDFRTNVASNSTLEFVLGVDEGNPASNISTIVTAQTNIANGDANIVRSSMAGLEKADSTHLTPAGIIDHGKRIYDSMFDLASAEPRIDFTDNTDGHLLLEPQSTNLLPYSEDFSQWSADDVEVVNNATTSPNGDVTATLIKGNTNASRHHVAKTALTNTVTASFSVFAKAKELRYLQVASANSTDQVANFDLLNGTIGTVGAGFSDVVLEEYPNDWYRISLVSLNRYNSFYISLVSSTTASWLESWTMSNNTDGLYIWGAQLEELSYATSYIPTNGGQVTRDAETCTGAGEAADFNSEEGVLYAEIAKVQDNPDHYRLISLNNADSNSDATSVTLGFDHNDNDFYIRIRSGGVNKLLTYTQNATTNIFHKIAIKYKSGNSAFFIDGNKLTNYNTGDGTETFTFPVALDNLSFDYNGNGTLPFYGKCKAIRVYKEALSDTDLENLTS